MITSVLNTSFDRAPDAKTGRYHVASVPLLRSPLVFDRLAILDGGHPDRPNPPDQHDRSHNEIHQLEVKQPSVPRQV